MVSALTISQNDRHVGGSGQSRQDRASARLWTCSPFPLPSCVEDAIPGHPASEHIIGIDLSLECLARWGLHVQLTLRSYVSLKLKIERRKLRNAIVNAQYRCNRIIRTLRPWGAHVLGETTNVRPIEEGGRTAGRCGCIARWRRCSRWWGFLRGASSDPENRHA
jgi:hypothetical protein